MEGSGFAKAAGLTSSQEEPTSFASAAGMNIKGKDFADAAGISLEKKQVNDDPWSNFTDTASRIAKERNYPANVLIGQAALESAHGTSNFAKNRNNFFGYQAYDSNPDAAKAYGSPEKSINDYLDLIQKNPRYSWAYQQYLVDHDSEKLLENIKASGYATDPNYVQKIKSLPEFKN